MIKTGIFLSVGNVFIALLSLVRNVLIARLVSVEDFGIAVTLATVVALVEMASGLGVDRLLVQARDGDSPVLQSTVHALEICRGMIGAATLVVLANPIAHFFGIPHAAWAYQAMALVPLMRGLAHLDIFRLQRQMRFLPRVSVELVPQFISAVSAVPAALYMGDYRAMLFTLILQQLIYTTTSHLIAERLYRVSWDKLVLRRVLLFGWPILLNGAIMFAIFQGDRIIVGGFIGMNELGWFSAAFSLTLMPSMVIAKTLQSFFLPQISPYKLNDRNFLRTYNVIMQASILSVTLFAIIFALAGPYIFSKLYGLNYEAGLSVLIWLTIMQALRIAKSGPVIVALSRGQTINLLVANIARIAMFPPALLFIIYGGDVISVVIFGIMGESLAFLISIVMLRRILSSPLKGLSISLLASGASLGLIAVYAYLWTSGSYDIGFLYAVQILLIAAIPVLIWSKPDLRRWVREAF